MTINKIHIIIAVAAVLTLAACDAHIETPDMTVRPGHVLCDDGTVLSYELYQTSGKRAVAIVFDTGKHGDTEENGRAVYLWDIAPKAFADTLGVEQGTSADTEAFDGNTNTFALYDTRETASPMAGSGIRPVVLRTERIHPLGGGDAPAVCGTGGRQSRTGKMRRRHLAHRHHRRLLVLDLDGSRGATDRQSVALLDRQRSHAGDPEDTGTPDKAHHYLEQLKITTIWKHWILLCLSDWC